MVLYVVRMNYTVSSECEGDVVIRSGEVNQGNNI